MNEVTLLDMLATNNYDDILSLKLWLIRYKNIGTIFVKENISEIPFDQPFEFYFHVTNGRKSYNNAFPIPRPFFKRWMNYNKYFSNLLPYYQSYYETTNQPSEEYFDSLSIFKGEKYVWLFSK